MPFVLSSCESVHIYDCVKAVVVHTLEYLSLMWKGNCYFLSLGKRKETIFRYQHTHTNCTTPAPTYSRARNRLTSEHEHTHLKEPDYYFSNSQSYALAI